MSGAGKVTRQIQDTIPFEYQVIREGLAEGKSDGKLRIRGVFQRADVKNGNGRVYERKIMEREVTRMNEAITNRQVVGEVDHPDDGLLRLGRASHLISSLSMEKDGTVMGELEILPTVHGDHLRALIEGGVRIGISSRGLGTVTKRENVEYVNDDYRMATFDVVSDPSTPGAWGTAVSEQTNQETVSDMDNKQRFATLKTEIARIVETKIGNLESEDRDQLVARAEESIEALDRLVDDDVGFKNVSERYVGRLKDKIAEVTAKDAPPTPSAKLAAANQVIEALVKQTGVREQAQKKKIEQAVAGVLERFQKASSRVSKVVDENKSLRRRAAVATAAGEEILRGTRMARVQEHVDALLSLPKFAEFAPARNELLKLSSIEAVNEVVKRLAEELGIVDTKPAGDKQTVKESNDGKKTPTAEQRLAKLSPKQARVVPEKNKATDGKGTPQNEQASILALISEHTGLR